MVFLSNFHTVHPINMIYILLFYKIDFCIFTYKMLNIFSTQRLNNFSFGSYTVCAKRSESICFLWYNLIVLWPIKSTLKSPEKLIFFLFPNKLRSDLSKKVVFDPLGPRATKLWAFKVCSCRESNPGRPKSSDSLL